MSILSDFEDRIGGALEGMFAGVFRSPVQPVEIARALAKAMDDGRTLGVGKIYAPLGYTVALSSEDDENFGAFLPTLSGELETYLTDHARERSYHLAHAPRVTFAVHDDLRLGRFRVSAELAAPEIAERVTTPTPAPETAYRPRHAHAVEPAVRVANRGPMAKAAEIAPRPLHAAVSVGEAGHVVPLTGASVVIGRLATSGVRLADANASREHAAFVREGDGWTVEDLGSTNGTYLNGQRISRERLRDGDVIEIGVTRIVYHEGLEVDGL